LFRGGREVDPALIDEFEELLYDADLGPVADNIISEVRRSHERGEIKGEDELRAVLRATLIELLRPSGAAAWGEIELTHAPTVVLVVGVNGSGKTTTIGKLAAKATAQGKRVVLAAGDTFRAAATEQLEVWGQRSGARTVKGKQGSDPGAVIFEALRQAQAEGADLVLCDTAGRLHTKAALMEELKRVMRIMEKALPGSPHEMLLVLDSTNGKNAIAQAREFHGALGVTGIVLTKLDGTAKGGVIIGICDELKVPVRYVGIGEAVGDLKPFDPKELGGALFG
jgi:fused signal recognition particle receptor